MKRADDQRCKGKVSGITKKEERKSVLEGWGKIKQIKSSHSSRDRHLNICASAVGQKESWGVRFEEWG